MLREFACVCVCVLGVGIYGTFVSVCVCVSAVSPTRQVYTVGSDDGVGRGIEVMPSDCV